MIGEMERNARLLADKSKVRHNMEVSRLEL
jgi:hypothetical protein